MERLEAAEGGLVEVSGRWFGVRGRRFVRPTLTLTPGDGGPERRWLADLEHKPWAAQDGEPWTAAFPVDVELASAAAIELAVAPDIEITLRPPPPDASTPGESAVAPQARFPVAKQDARGRRPTARAQDLERLTTRLSFAESALDREHERRAAVESALEELRAESRKLSAELGRARAELDLARTVQREAEGMSAELDSARRELRAAGQRHEQLTQEHDRVIEAHAQVEFELRERSGALESARDALEQERERGSQALAQEQARAAEALELERALRSDELAQESTRRTEELARERARADERLRSAQARATATRGPGSDRPDELEELDELGPPDAQSERRRRERAPDRRYLPERGHEARARAAAPQRIERPLNPALQSRTNWVGRLLALLVIVAVAVAVWLVLHSTILH